MRADASAVELAGGEVGHLVAENLLEKSVGGTFEMRRETDEAAVGIAAAEASREARAPLDATLGVELRYRPEAEPVAEGFGEMRGEAGLGRHGGKASTRGEAGSQRAGDFRVPLGSDHGPPGRHSR
jgi:hypothetical protein